MEALFRFLARFPRLPLELAFAMLGIAVWIEWRDPAPPDWLSKIPLALLLAWAALRPAHPPTPRRQGAAPASGGNSRTGGRR